MSSWFSRLTLVDLAVVLAVIALLAALMTPAVESRCTGRGAAARQAFKVQMLENAPAEPAP